MRGREDFRDRAPDFVTAAKAAKFAKRFCEFRG
jgi:hypothetical protein